jgi:methylated-DNA-protein-cysteine methyltransferase-like protein
LSIFRPKGSRIPQDRGFVRAYLSSIGGLGTKVYSCPLPGYPGPMTESTLRIIRVLQAVSPGRVSCYRDIARAAGLSAGGARQVVRVLHSLSGPHKLPWHRIIRADGRVALAPGAGRELQIGLLRAEGVEVSPLGQVSPAFFWNPLGKGEP